ncbi:hypothetical protein [Paenibacillus sp.]|jgi:hypothetical protein|uniref:hypothetical protein n=1 Tax=Paenibacillus sp. TaxID=58172 RepID=UPI0028309466|nr:hypothetical protein [Paenibacillus sp.]MDR0267541.1 hypothetical protein [Paenibacillus sp.]
MKKSNVTKLLSLTVAVSALSMLLATGAGAESYVADDTSASTVVKEPGALTSPPPQEFSPLSISGNYQYLAGGNSYISAISNGKLQINGDTSAKTVVSTIRATVYLQRYNGVSYEDVSASSAAFVKNSSNYVAGDATFTGIKGYYYRTKCVHSITNTIYEESVEYSGPVLCY